MKKRILFVDNNPLLLRTYAEMLNEDRDRWEVATACEAGQAMETMDRESFDVVVCEASLPGARSIELFSKIKKRHPHASRILMSDYSEQEDFTNSFKVAHQFLAKPFDVKTLKATLGRISALDAFLQDDNLRSLIGLLGALPTFPSLYFQIVKELKSEEPSLENVANIIAKDPSLTAKMLQAVNSAMFGLANRVSNPFDAVQYLGMSMVQSLAISAHVFSSFEKTTLNGFSADQLWAHSMRSASRARAIMRAEKSDAADIEDACTAAMLHDIGKLMLADNLPELYHQALALASKDNILLHEAEQKIFGATHAGAAAYLLGLWGLPATIVEAVAFHHAPGRSSLRAFGPLTAVHVADVLEHKSRTATSSGAPPEFDLNYLIEIGVQNRLDAWRTQTANSSAAM
ncbi:MAG TPA: response regulator [Candidatus Saccharimonadales bacterium]|nr:response regulator [Candidatus Saccharimonadales bacterium]